MATSGLHIAADPTQLSMMAWCIYTFGPPDVMRFEQVLRPTPGQGEVLVKVEAAGVGPRDAWIRAGKSALPQRLPLTPGSDLSGEIVAVGPAVSDLRVGDQIYGVTNAQFIGAYAEYAVASATTVSKKPTSLTLHRSCLCSCRGRNGMAGVVRPRAHQGRPNARYSRGGGKRRSVCGSAGPSRRCADH
jgi:NADPH:quinone reductase-like Zn-dependent oxidoreductase